MIGSKWLKDKNNKDEFSPYRDILLSDTDLENIKKIPATIFEKLFLITEAELGKRVLKKDISIGEARGAIQFALYLRKYFKN